MRFKTRLLGIYTILCLLVASSVAALYYYYNQKLYKETERQILRNSSAHLVNNFNIVLENMKFATTYVIGENEFLDSLNLLLKNQDNIDCPIYYKQEALLNIKQVLARDFLTKNFHAVQIFNEEGLLIEYDSALETMSSHKDEIEKKQPWLAELADSKNSVILTDRHLGEGKQETQVISMIRKVLGYNVYIEVQYSAEKIEEQLNFKEDIKGVFVIDEKDEILYSAGKQLDKEILSHIDIIDTPNYEKLQMKVPAAISNSEDYGIKIITIGDLEKQEEALKRIRNISMLIALITMGILFICVNISAEILIKPVKKLQGIMEITEFEKMDEEIEFNSQIRELDDLATSHAMLLKRLQKSMIKNQKMEQLYLEAQLDSLQSKISPHFMANILNVISSRGLELGDREICQISSSMGALLRYSTDSRSQLVPVEEEVHYLKNYCYLMKSRYMQKLIYNIKIEEEVCSQLIPKLSLQQLVENSIKHGFKECGGTMEINVQGWKEGDRWFISVQDNGEGITDEQIKRIFIEAEDKKKQIQRQDKNVQLTLGGMGLVNLYLRMFFQYGDKMIFEVRNKMEGSEVLIGGVILEKR